MRRGGPAVSTTITVWKRSVLRSAVVLDRPACTIRPVLRHLPTIICPAQRTWRLPPTMRCGAATPLPLLENHSVALSSSTVTPMVSARTPGFPLSSSVARSDASVCTTIGFSGAVISVMVAVAVRSASPVATLRRNVEMVVALTW